MKKEQAENAGFATFNNGNHICLDLPQDHVTISVKTPDGNKLTFAFVPRCEGEGHQCVDIQHHSGILNKEGTPLQNVILFGQGPTVARSNPKDEVPATLTTVLLK